MQQLDSSIQQKLETLVIEGDRVAALALLRKETGLGLKEAIGELEQMERSLPYPRWQARPISIWASLFAIGPFSETIAEYLDYPDEMYSGTRSGVSIITGVTGWDTAPERPIGQEMLTCLGLSSEWELGRQIDPGHVDIHRWRQSMRWLTVNEQLLYDVIGQISDRSAELLDTLLPRGGVTQVELFAELDRLGLSADEAAVVTNSAATQAFGEVEGVDSFVALHAAGFEFFVLLNSGEELTSIWE